MPVPLAQVATVKEAYDYATGSYSSATKCPSARSLYSQIASDIKDAVMSGDVQWSDNVEQLKAVMPSSMSFANTILAINKKCIAEAGSAPSVSVQPKNGGGGDGGVVITQKAGFPLWLILLIGGGALAYYLMSKKEGSDVSRGRSMARKVKEKIKRKKNPGRRRYR